MIDTLVPIALQSHRFQWFAHSAIRSPRRRQRTQRRTAAKAASLAPCSSLLYQLMFYESAAALVSARGKFKQKCVMQLPLRLLPCRYSIGKDLVAAQVVSLALEADGGPPAVFGCLPVYAGDTAGVIPADRLGPQHLHTGAVDVRQPMERRVLDRKSVV